MKKLFAILSLAALLVSCGSTKNNSTTEAAEPEVSTLTSFSAFLRDFTSDVDFQMSRIRFPLGEHTGVTNSDGSHPEYTRELWAYRTMDYFTIDPNNESGGFVIENENKVTFECWGEYIDYFSTYTFERIDGIWMLTAADEAESGMCYYKEWVQGVKSYNAKHLRKNPANPAFVPYEPIAVEGDYPEASVRELTDADFEGKSKEELRIMRNEIFARHGRMFKARDLQKHFLATRWYAPLFDNVDDKLSAVEKANVDKIAAVENSL